MKKLLITNVVYGNLYSDIFLNQHLKSLLDESNIPACKDRVEYLIFSDRDTFPKITTHENFVKLRDLIPIELCEIGWPEQPIDRFEIRYSIIMGMFKESVKKALSKNMLLSAIVADLVAARSFLPKLFMRIDSGFDSVFMLPPRCVYEVVGPELDKYPRAMHADDLWTLCYAAMHPLWSACHVGAAQFTKLPFSLIWNSTRGLLVRSFSITPVVLTPDEKMLEGRGMIDGEIPALCKNPYWATDWTDAPIMGVEPLICYFPPFANHLARAEWVNGWSKNHLHPSQLMLAKERLYYPSKEAAEIPEAMELNSDVFMGDVLK